MGYSPINVDVYTNAYSGAIAGMAVSGWITDPTAADYAKVTAIAGAFAAAFDTVWNDATALNWLQIQAIQSVIQEQFAGHAPGSLDNPSFTQAANWAIPAAACAALVLEGDAYVTGQGIIPNTPSTGGGSLGSAGPPGQHGDDGEDGITIPGTPGVDGLQGSAGPPGQRGDDGEDGITIPGTPGVDGLQGSAGPPGQRGDDGEDGITIPCAPPSDFTSFAPIVTTANFTQPAVNANIQVKFTTTTGLQAGNPLYIVGGGLYTVISIDSGLLATVENTGVQENAVPTTVIASGAVASLAHGRSWTRAYEVATVANVWKVPTTASPIITGTIRAASGGGGGGGGGGPGFNAATTGGGGSGGRGGGQGMSAAEQVIYPITVTPGETLTVDVGAAGTGGALGAAGAPGSNGGTGGNTQVVGSTSGLVVQTPNLASVPAGGGPAGLTGAVINGGASPAIGTGTNATQNWGTGSFAGAQPPASGAGGASTAGANGSNVANQPATAYLRFGITGTFNGALGNSGGTGNAVNRGGGGAGGTGAGGGNGDTLRINGVVAAATDGVGGTSGHGGAADTNAGLTAGGNGQAGKNGQGGAGGGGGGGGGSAVGSALPGAAGGNGGNGSDGRLVLQGTIL